ncbi:MAG: heavy metal translocating P-type ATPase [Polyangiaceae bacterium]
MKTEVIQVGGMTCAACVTRVERAIGSVPGVHEVSVDLSSHRARVVWGAEGSKEALFSAVRNAGYEVAERSAPDPDLQIETRLRSELRISLIFSIPLFALGMSHERILSGWPSAVLQLALALAIMAWPGRGYFVRAWHALRARSSDMNTLVALGASTSFGYSLVALVLQGEHAAHRLGLYFETAGIIVTFALLGRVLESGARKQLGSALTSLLALRPDTSHRVSGADEADVPTAVLAPGDVVIVRPGERIPVDGEVTFGVSEVDESMLTGEALATPKAAHARVLAGTINGAGALTVRVTARSGETELDRVAEALESTAKNAPISRVVDRVSRVFVPAVLFLAAATFAAWFAMNPHVTGLPMATQRCVAVLVIACPCALGLATPAAIRVALGRAAELGMQIRGGAVLEEASRVDCVLFDKTGTLTRGKPELTEVIAAGEHEPLALAAAVERVSEHPLARAIIARARAENVDVAKTRAFGVEVGAGAWADMDGEILRVGTAQWLRASGVDVGALERRAQKAMNEGATVVFVARGAAAAGALVLRDEPVDAAFSVVRTLEVRGYEIAMVTGDHTKTAAHVAKRLRIAEVLAEQKPQDKLARVQELQARGRTVAMVGDGINDSLALARANVAIAMGTGTGAALHVADVALVGASVAALPALFELARATMRTIHRNLGFAFVYNVVGIPLAAGLFRPFLHFELSPMFASAAMSLSSVSVLTSSLLLRRFHPRKPAPMKNTELAVTGMTCGNCVRHVEKALRELQGVSSVVVTLDPGTAKVQADDSVGVPLLVQAIEDAGYSAVAKG